MFVGQIVMCLAEVILCQSVSSHTGEFTKCDEFIGQRPGMCKVISMSGEDVQVNCYEDFKKRYNIADNVLNKNPSWIKKDLCDEHAKLP